MNVSFVSASIRVHRWARKAAGIIETCLRPKQGTLRRIEKGSHLLLPLWAHTKKKKRKRNLVGTLLFEPSSENPQSWGSIVCYNARENPLSEKSFHGLKTQKGKCKCFSGNKLFSMHRDKRRGKVWSMLGRSSNLETKTCTENFPADVITRLAMRGLNNVKIYLKNRMPRIVCLF